MRLSLLLRLAALGLVAALFAVLVYRLVHGSGSGVAQAAKAHREPKVPDVRVHVISAGAGLWPRGLRRPAAGDELGFADLHGYPLVINFWASWCDPCRREAPALAAAARAERGRVIFVGVDVNDLGSDASHFLRDHHVPYAVARGSGSVTDRFGVVGLPETFYVDAAGRIKDVTEGQVTAAILARELRSS